MSRRGGWSAHVAALAVWWSVALLQWASCSKSKSLLCTYPRVLLRLWHINAWEKFDGPLNSLLQRPPDELRSLVHVGEKGLIGLCHFLEYLVQHHKLLVSLA